MQDFFKGVVLQLDLTQAVMPRQPQKKGGGGLGTFFFLKKKVVNFPDTGQEYSCTWLTSDKQVSNNNNNKKLDPKGVFHPSPGSPPPPPPPVYLPASDTSSV